MLQRIIIMRLNYNKCMSSKKVEQCDREAFESILNSKTLRETLTTYRRLIEDLKDADGEMRKTLEERRETIKKTMFPMFLPQAKEFADNVRSKENAVEGYFDTGDYDHCAIDVKAYVEALRKRVDFRKEGIVFAEVSVSGGGLHVWALAREGETVVDAQVRLESLVGLKRDTAMDKVVQGSLLSGDVLYYDADLMWADEGKHAFIPMAEDAHVSSAVPLAGNSTDGVTLTLGGVPYADIVNLLMEKLGEGPIIEGMRHSRMIKLALILRNVCDYNPNTLFSIMPATTPPLPEGELRRICTDACRKEVDRTMPKVLLDTIRQLGIGSGPVVEDTEEQLDRDEEYGLYTMPRLPKLFDIFARLCPPEYREAMTMALLPVLGTLATGLRGVYNQNEFQRLNFQTILIGPMASCKSRILGIATETLLRKMKEEEKLMWLKEQEAKERIRLGKKMKADKRGAAAETPNLTLPKLPIRNIPSTNSVAQLMYRMQNAGGKHLFSVENEIGTVANTNRSGTWASKKEIYKEAFSNEEHGQDYRNEDSFSAMLPVCYNLLFAGTYAAVMGFYDKKSANDGLVTRTIPVFTPSNFGAKRPLFRSLTEKDEAYVYKMVDVLTSIDEEVECRKLQKAIDRWIDEKKSEAVQTNSEAVDVFCHRAAIIGFRVGMLAYVLEGRRETKVMLDFAVWAAERVMRNQVRIWGECLDDASLSVQPSKRNIYALLGSVFTASDLKNAMGNNPTSNAVAVVICRWKKAGLIEKTGTNTYRKTAEKH